MCAIEPLFASLRIGTSPQGARQGKLRRASQGNKVLGEQKVDQWKWVQRHAEMSKKRCINRATVGAEPTGRRKEMSVSGCSDTLREAKRKAQKRLPWVLSRLEEEKPICVHGCSVTLPERGI